MDIAASFITTNASSLVHLTLPAAMVSILHMNLFHSVESLRLHTHPTDFHDIQKVSELTSLQHLQFDGSYGHCSPVDVSKLKRLNFLDLFFIEPERNMLSELDVWFDSFPALETLVIPMSRVATHQSLASQLAQRFNDASSDHQTRLLHCLFQPSGGISLYSGSLVYWLASQHDPLLRRLMKMPVVSPRSLSLKGNLINSRSAVELFLEQGATDLLQEARRICESEGDLTPFSQLGYKILHTNPLVLTKEWIQFAITKVGVGINVRNQVQETPLISLARAYSVRVSWSQEVIQGTKRKIFIC
jgi:hypothetical protein